MIIWHETNFWSWFWVHKSIKKWKILKNTKKKIFSIFLKNFLLPFFQLFGQFRVYKSNLIFQISPFLKNLTHLTVLKIRKKQKILFSKIIKKKIFLYFLIFFFSDRIYTPKTMTNNLSHVLSSWLCAKKVCDMHTLCIPRHTKDTLCS